MYGSFPNLALFLPLVLSTITAIPITEAPMFSTTQDSVMDYSDDPAGKSSSILSQVDSQSTSNNELGATFGLFESIPFSGWRERRPECPPRMEASCCLGERFGDYERLSDCDSWEERKDFTACEDRSKQFCCRHIIFGIGFECDGIYILSPQNAEKKPLQKQRPAVCPIRHSASKREVSACSSRSRQGILGLQEVD